MAAARRLLNTRRDARTCVRPAHIRADDAHPPPGAGKASSVGHPHRYRHLYPGYSVFYRGGADGDGLSFSCQLRRNTRLCPSWRGGGLCPPTGQPRASCEALDPVAHRTAANPVRISVLPFYPCRAGTDRPRAVPDSRAAPADSDRPAGGLSHKKAVSVAHRAAEKTPASIHLKPATASEGGNLCDRSE